jgi:hypothetical protein
MLSNIGKQTNKQKKTQKDEQIAPKTYCGGPNIFTTPHRKYAFFSYFSKIFKEFKG